MPSACPTLVIHGGAGVIERAAVSPELEAAFRRDLTLALEAGAAKLRAGGPALAAVIAAVEILEDSPLFNAGRGSVLNARGECELDASLMDGATRRAGAVAGVRTIRHPIALAADVMRHSDHVMLAGPGAEEFARHLGHPVTPPEFFITARRQEQLRRAQTGENGEARAPANRLAFRTVDENDDLAKLEAGKFGTVGAVALDAQGHLAAGTSTGGLTNKRYGRVGDSPLIGAGTYADDATCAVSATGQGEFFMRTVLAHDVAARLAYGGVTLEQAAHAALAQIARLGGLGGFIALDRQGNLALPFNTTGMYRGWWRDGEAPRVALYREDN
jgi:L-asparaginase / beta-aspartyl-peptidase